ncbi:3-deoxy-7-phosphoheptulonate synthase [Deinococcus sp. HMF7604]|uniref:3-deoxy-7-phosphoheptulonate synthase n=1 Tax=Deinococcus betulae TaxID=2873312 RepID=UPI001CCD3D90|nr:3-deoxy-7-phosphoheptulonate synthase [Deinococcus betulae]MBZ9750140.1 3-deoxy-7-phosphoheptulonate synthase [Deinococcus betulae]
MATNRFTPVVTPQALHDLVPQTPQAARTVKAARGRIQAILRGQDDRLLMLVGPCSIHSEAEALLYAQRLAETRRRWGGELELVMRVYVEKPRTTLGWRGFLLDPELDGRLDLNAGLRRTRTLMRAVNELGVPVATEVLDPNTPPYLADQLAWACIGARTVESQIHRMVASGLPCPVGFKNGTSGSVKVAADAVVTAQAEHAWWTASPDGAPGLHLTPGNPDGHVVLRGGWDGPNADPASVRRAAAQLSAARLNPALVVDCSHANSGSDHTRQGAVARSVLAHLAPGGPMRGLMLESQLHGGRQPFPASGQAPLFGVSVTDACLSWDDTQDVLAEAAATVRALRCAPEFDWREPVA